MIFDKFMTIFEFIFLFFYKSVLFMFELYALNVKKARGFIMSKDAAMIVSSERLERSYKFRYESDFLLSMGGELLARAIIRENLGLENKNINFGKTFYGKPFLINSADFYFNVSHSGEFVICVFADTETGCDCELIDPAAGLENIKIVYTNREYELIHSLNDSDKIKLSYNIWTLKESYLKCAGIGLNEEPASVEISFNNCYNDPVIMKNGRQLDYILNLNNGIKGYSMAVCVKKHQTGLIPEAPKLNNKIKFIDENYLYL